MYKTATCQACQEEIYLKSSAQDRGDLAIERNEFFQIECLHCGERQEVHVNMIKAKKSQWIMLLAYSILMIGTPIVFWLIWPYVMHPSGDVGLIGVVVIPFAVYKTISKSEEKRVRVFNEYRI
jgi:predicted nucleic-acid-binding Zn-ribbon protein